MTHYEKMLAMGKEAALLNGIDYLLQWDQETYMPSKGAEVRADHIQLIAKLLHQKRTGAALKNQLAKLVGIKTGKIKGKHSKQEQAAIKEWREDYLRATKLPLSFVEASARLTSQATEAWRSAREANSYARFAPFLEKLVDTARKRADYLGYSGHPFDALVDEHEPGMTHRKVSTLFTGLREELVPFRNKLREKGDPERDFLHKRYPQQKQMAFVETLLEAVGFSNETGNVALTTHPFCIALHPNDGRITTRVNEHAPIDNFLAAMHEGGHWLYETSLPQEHFGSPLCEALSTAIHESQSRTWETIIGQSLPFWKHFYPKLQAAFKSQLEGVSLKDFHRGLNAVLDTPIRVESDEVSYPLHVIIRFEIESALIDGRLTIRELPEAWNAKYEQYLGITPKTDTEGCLQDVHWSAGLFGYFPTYLIGNLYAGQFWQTFEGAHPKWEKQVAAGEFGFIRNWLKENIHLHGRMYPPPALCKRITGKALSSEPYLDYLTNKYKHIYNH